MENKIPKTRHVLVCHQTHQIPIYETQQIRELNDEEVLIKTEGTGISHLEPYMMSGAMDWIKFPFVPGSNISGTVLKTGKKAQHLLGKRVVAGEMYGLWTDYGIVNADKVIPIEQDVPLESAAFGFINPFTAVGVLDTAKKQGKKSIVVDAAASSVGKIINRIAISENIPIINIVRRKDQEELLRNLGAKNIVVTSEANWKESYEKLCDQLRPDCLIDSLGRGQILDTLVKGIISGGLIIVIGHLDGSSQIVRIGEHKKVQVGDHTFEGWGEIIWFNGLTKEQKQKFKSAHSQGLKNELSTTVSNTFHLKDIREALQQFKKSNTKGRILLIP